MNVMLVSQCSKNALTETRRILDQFAERRGDGSWQTAITQQGLSTLHRMLRKTARKNTAVACHWIRGRDHSELIWVVGDARRFNAQGATPTNSTERDVLRGKDENDWHTAEEMSLLVSLAALLHDLGKANNAFQKKLTNKSKKALADAYRHEWVSLRLFEAFVRKRSDSEWLEDLANLSHVDRDVWITGLIIDGPATSFRSPLNRKSKLPPLAQVIGWLMVSHHRLPAHPDRKNGLVDKETMSRYPSGIAVDWCGARTDMDAAQQQTCWECYVVPSMRESESQ